MVALSIPAWKEVRTEVCTEAATEAARDGVHSKLAIITASRQERGLCLSHVSVGKVDHRRGAKICARDYFIDSIIL